jgi:hypothetical protein
MEVQQLYAAHCEPRTRPSLEDFHRVLCSTVAEFSKVFLVVDAWDEYPEERRNTLLHSLSNLGPNVNLMLTCRTIINIIPAVLGETQTLEIKAAKEDIRRYLNAQIDSSEWLLKELKTRRNLREEIETTCVDRSDGMWVLQLLRREICSLLILSIGFFWQNFTLPRLQQSTR